MVDDDDGDDDGLSCRQTDIGIKEQVNVTGCCSVHGLLL